MGKGRESIDDWYKGFTTDLITQLHTLKKKKENEEENTLTLHRLLKIHALP